MLPPRENFNSSRDDRADRSYEWEIVRAPKNGGCLDFVVCSETAVEQRIHYTPQGTQPCQTGECPWCKQGNDSRFRAYVQAVNNDTGAKILVEMPLDAWLPIESAAAARGVLRGALVRLFRRGPGDKARVASQVKGFSARMREYPEATDPWADLCKLWKLSRSKVRRSSGSGPGAKTVGEEAQALKHSQPHPPHSTTGPEMAAEFLSLALPQDLAKEEDAA